MDSLEELTLRGKEALLSKGVSPRELQEFDAQMQAFAVRFLRSRCAVGRERGLKPSRRALDRNDGKPNPLIPYYYHEGLFLVE